MDSNAFMATRKFNGNVMIFWLDVAANFHGNVGSS